MSARPQDYVSDHGRLTTNAVEGFHCLALLYQDKRTDLGHTQYSCKTNMAICRKVINHKRTNSKSMQQNRNLYNLGLIWKVFCLMRMGVNIPRTAVSSILKEHRVWEKDKQRKT